MIKVNSATSKQSHLSQRVHESHVHSFVYGSAKRFSLGFSQVANFSRHYLVSRRQIPRRCGEIVQCLSSVATFSGCMFTRDVITRFRDEKHSVVKLCKTFHSLSTLVHVVISIFTVLQNPCLHLFRTEFSCYTCARERIFQGIFNAWHKIRSYRFLNIFLNIYI